MAILLYSLSQRADGRQGAAAASEGYCRGIAAMSGPNQQSEHDVYRGSDAPGGLLVMRAEVVQQWIDAYTRYADALQEVHVQIAARNEAPSFGNLDSLRQLSQGYHDLLTGNDGSLRVRLEEHIQFARDFASTLEQNWRTIQAEDIATASALQQGPVR